MLQEKMTMLQRIYFSPSNSHCKNRDFVQSSRHIKSWCIFFNGIYLLSLRKLNWDTGYLPSTRVAVAWKWPFASFESVTQSTLAKYYVVVTLEPCMGDQPVLTERFTILEHSNQLIHQFYVLVKCPWTDPEALNIVKLGWLLVSSFKINI